ncbi:MAG TPA: ABC transporter permease [Terriglobia bacterium]|nr:ABC transporter permease [Terriglobia bacterium]
MKFPFHFKRRDEREQELDEEIRAHLAMAIRERIEQGEDPAEAEANVRREFGNVPLVKEVTRDQWGWRWLETFLQDVRYGIRQLRRNPGFSLAVIAIAALGIAATCVVFCFADAAIFGALPYKNPSSLVEVAMADLKNDPGWNGVPVPVFLSWRDHAGSIGQFAANLGQLKGKALVGGAKPVLVFDNQISPATFRLFGVRPLIGRGFQASDYESNGTRALLLSYNLWQQLFNGRSGAIGKSITLDAVGHTIVGIMPPGFLLPGSSAAMEPSCWTPLVFDAKQKSATGDFSLTVWSRLRPGISQEKARAALSVSALEVVNPTGARKNSDWRIQVTPLMDKLIDHWRSVLAFLFGAAGFLLAIACSNVTNLLLARARTRQKEIAVRAAIGASRARVIRQLLTECLILSGAAGAAGILLAYWGVGWERAILPPWFHTTNFQQMGIDLRILAATVAVSVAVGAVFGLAPALHASKVDLVDSLKEGRTIASPRRGRWNTQSVFVIAEVVLSSILLTGAVLMLRSFLKLEGVEPGFNPHEMLTMRMLLPKYRYPKPEGQIAAYQQVLQEISAIPGVAGAGFVTPLPMTGINATVVMPAQPGMSNVPENRKLGVGFHAVSPGYFDTMGIPLLRGRFFTDQDTHDSELVAIVDRAFVDRYWPGQNPVGKVFYLHYPKPTPVVHIVGEVGSVRDLALADKPRPELYNPFTQHFFAEFAGTLIIKTSTPGSTAVAVQKAVHSVDPEAPISQIETMREVLGKSVAEKRLYLTLVGVFAMLALVLAAAGIAGTVSYAVSQRKHEVGIRMALGARRLNVLFMIVGQVSTLVVVGIVLGVVGSLAFTRFIASQLYGVSPTDPVTFVVASLILIAVALLACYIPARRAAKVDPMVALRYE